MIKETLTACGSLTVGRAFASRRHPADFPIGRSVRHVDRGSFSWRGRCLSAREGSTVVGLLCGLGRAEARHRDGVPTLRRPASRLGQRRADPNRPASRRWLSTWLRAVRLSAWWVLVAERHALGGLAKARPHARRRRGRAGAAFSSPASAASSLALASLEWTRSTSGRLVAGGNAGGILGSASVPARPLGSPAGSVLDRRGVAGSLAFRFSWLAPPDAWRCDRTCAALRERIASSRRPPCRRRTLRGRGNSVRGGCSCRQCRSDRPTRSTCRRTRVVRSGRSKLFTGRHRAAVRSTLLAGARNVEGVSGESIELTSP